jgi:AcrR family transcriptional regulator
MAHPDPGPPNSTRAAATRRRLLDAANQLFEQQGYEAATAAAIAATAGTTERTFFRHFPTKADVLVANWERHGAALTAALDAPRGPDVAVAVVVHDALHAFVRGVSDELDAGLDSVVRLYTDQAAFLAIMEHLLGVESELARGIATHTGRAADDFDVRVAANGSMGVVRASIRAAVLDPSGPPMLELLDRGLRELEPIFAVLTGRAGPR